jgi:diguanylate cyclase (GGDEF)-like protein
VLYADITATAVRDASGELTAMLSLVVDASEQMAVRREADEAREHLRGAIDSLLDPWVYLVAVRDSTGSIVDFEYADANNAACQTNARSREDLLGARLLDLLPGHVDNGLLRRYAEVVETGTSLALDDFPYRSELSDGEVRWFDNRAVRVGDGLSFTWRDVTDRVLARQRLAAQATTDSLTGLANRQHLMDTLEVAFERVPRRGEHIAILYCDLDGLKWVNDTYGHEFGDAVLRTIADRMVGAVRAEDLVARIGGDEFVVLADGITDREAALALATKIAAAVTRPVTHAGSTTVPTLSIGVSLSAPGDDSVRALRLADEALYRQKLAGRGVQDPLDLA